MIFTVLLYFILALLASLGSIFIGWILLKTTTSVKPDGLEQKIFIYGLVGIGTLVTIVSLLKTCGQTIHIGLLIFVLILAIVNRGVISPDPSRLKSMPSRKEAYKLITYLSIVLCCIFFLAGMQSFSFKDLDLLIPNRDVLYYASLSEALWETGIENNYFYGSEISDQLTGMVPYHYFLEWFNALIYGVFGTNPTISFLLITIPTFAVVVVFGFMSLVRKFAPSASAWKIILLGMAGLLVQTYFPSSLLQGEEFKHLDALSYTPIGHGMYCKALPIYLGLLLSILFYYKEKHFEAILTLTLLPVFNISTLPSIAAAIPLVIGFAVITKKMKPRMALKTLMGTGLILGAVLLLYTFLGNPLASDLLRAKGVTIASYLKDDLYRQDIFYLLKWVSIETVVAYCLPLISIVGLSFYFKRSFNKKTGVLAAYSLVIWFCGLFAWVLLRFLGQDSYQFLTLLGIACLNITFWVILLSGWGTAKRSVHAGALIVLFLFAGTTVYNLFRVKNTSLHHYSSSFISEAFKINEELGNPVKVVSLSDSTYQKTASNRDPFFSSTLCGCYWHMLPGEDKIFNIDALHIAPSGSVGRFHEIRMLESAPIKLLSDKDYTSKFRSAAKIDFIDKVGAKIYLYEKGVVVDEGLRKRFSHTITDSISGETLAVISEKPVSLP